MWARQSAPKQYRFHSGKEGKDSFIHIIDERKILELIGEEHLDNWIFSIEKESTLDLVKDMLNKQNC